MAHTRALVTIVTLAIVAVVALGVHTIQMAEAHWNECIEMVEPTDAALKWCDTQFSGPHELDNEGKARK